MKVIKENAWWGLVLISILVFSCKHAEPPVPGGQGGPGGCGIAGVSTGPNANCDQGVVYYQRDIQPILNSSCAFSGCHDAGTAADDIVLDNYDNTLRTGKIEPCDPGGSDFYTVLMDDPEDIMPPAPYNKLPQDQINTIAKWIEQGAQNFTCSSSGGGMGCDTMNVGYAARIAPIIELNCRGCHSGGSPAGGVPLTNFSEVKASADNGSLMGTLLASGNFNIMPPAGPLSDCDITTVQAWIDQGAQNN